MNCETEGLEGELAGFAAITRERVLDAVEEALNARCNGVLRPLPSYINRVYSVDLASGEQVVAKFYRPERWSKEAILEEHAFVKECQDEEIPVIAPMLLANGRTLGEVADVSFAVFPKRGGRPIEPADPGNSLWQRLGALLARVHQIGERQTAPARLRLHPYTTTVADLEYLLDGTFLEAREAQRLEQFGMALFERIVPLFENTEIIRLHGDCQHTNVLERPDTGLMLIDFDDMLNGTPVQDLWMLLPGRLAESRIEMQQMLDGYETFRAFDYRTLRLIEPLRAMRMTYYLAWCARQAHDVAFMQNHPGWGTRAFWATELTELEVQLDVIEQCECDDDFKNKGGLLC